MSRVRTDIIDMKETGKLLQYLTEKKGLEVSKLKLKLNVNSSQSIYNWFKGDNIPSIDNLLRLSNLLDIPIDQLIVTKEEYYSSKTEFNRFILDQELPAEDYKRMEEICFHSNVPFHDLIEIYCRGFKFYDASVHLDNDEIEPLN